MIVRFFTSVELTQVTTTIGNDGSISIQTDTFRPRAGRMMKIEEIVPVADKRYMDIILPAGETESKVLKNVDTLTCSILGVPPDVSNNNNSEDNLRSTGSCCS